VQGDSRSRETDSVASKDVVVWKSGFYWIPHRRSCRDVMWETFRTLASIGEEWEDHDIEDHYKNEKKLRSHKIECTWSLQI
uniref:Uncharacterized protein n=1 Tax=Rhinolophus ferrumequinum TaxID=59479 RepID=A0A671DT95_RHIFE